MKYKTKVTNTKFKINNNNNAYLMSQNHHQILENDRLPMEREIERERDDIEKKPIQNNKEQIKKKNQTSINNR